MSSDTVSIALTPKERRFIAAWRDVPAGQARELLDDTLQRLVEYVREPKCAEMQADGVPCATPSSDCEQCAKLKVVLGELRHSLQGV